MQIKPVAVSLIYVTRLIGENAGQHQLPAAARSICKQRCKHFQWIREDIGEHHVGLDSRNGLRGIKFHLHAILLGIRLGSKHRSRIAVHSESTACAKF